VYLLRLKYFVARIDKFVLSGIAIAFLIVSLAVVILEPLLGWPASLQEHVPGISLFLLSTFALYYVQREQVITEYLRWKDFGIEAIYSTRLDSGQAESYRHLLQSIRKEIFIVGITLKDVPRDHGALLFDKGKNGRAIKLLMLSPEYWRNDDPVLDPVAAATQGNLRPDFQIAISHIRALALDMARAGVDFEVKFYRQAPTLSLTIVDGQEPGAKMRVELTPHNRPQEEKFRPMLVLRRSSESDLFSQFYKCYLALWQKSQAYIRIVDSKVMTDAALDKKISDILDLGFDWLPDELKPPETPVGIQI
jgi:hypothetical protein